MDLPVPNSASSSVVLMWVNFLLAPRKSVFPVSPGAKENCQADKASFRAPQGLQRRQHGREEGRCLKTGNPSDSPTRGRVAPRTSMLLFVLVFFFVSLSLIKAGHALWSKGH